MVVPCPTPNLRIFLYVCYIIDCDWWRWILVGQNKLSHSLANRHHPCRRSPQVDLEPHWYLGICFMPFLIQPFYLPRLGNDIGKQWLFLPPCWDWARIQKQWFWFGNVEMSVLHWCFYRIPSGLQSGLIGPTDPYTKLEAQFNVSPRPARTALSPSNVLEYGP